MEVEILFNPFEKSNARLVGCKLGVLVDLNPRAGQLFFFLRGSVWCAFFFWFGLEVVWVQGWLQDQLQT